MTPRRRSRIAGRLALAGALVFTAACGRGLPEMPPPMPAPEISIDRPTLDEAGFEVLPPHLPRATDPILDGTWASHPGLRSEVGRWLDRWTDPPARSFPLYLQRMTRYEELVAGELAARGLPPSLRYLPIIESGYSTTAVSRASAVGLWQLMAPTARASGLEVGALVDERRDPVAATRVALGYIEELYERFGSWTVVLAAYNGGPSRVDRLLRRYAPGWEPSDDAFWVIRPHLPRETRDFVPRFIAAALVARDPAAFGMRLRTPLEPLAFDEVTVPDATSLDVVARAAGVSEWAVEDLNPHVLRGITPDGKVTPLKVPAGSGWRFDFEYPRIPPDRRVTVAEHVVERGETLWGIARRYGVRLAVLREANPELSPDTLRPGDRVVVPLLPRYGSGRRGR